MKKEFKSNIHKTGIAALISNSGPQENEATSKKSSDNQEEEEEEEAVHFKMPKPLKKKIRAYCNDHDVFVRDFFIEASKEYLEKNP
jgi:hypothetical protein